ncbi:hypothetical protein [Dongia sp.]|uniref:hypothetical protein n=1 Tax=Dongia sp. TaxID=1977262 RepID=UPI00375076BB
MTNSIASRGLRTALIAFSGALLLGLAACGTNTYGPPPAGGKPQNWGQQHYLDNQRYQQLNLDRLN